MAPLLAMLAATAASAPTASHDIRAWFFTDPHTDPQYTPGAPAEGCYCRDTRRCPARPGGAHCAVDAPWRAVNNTAQVFGNGEANCETPLAVLYASLAHALALAPDVPLVFHGGDFCAYMEETPCDSSAPQVRPALASHLTALRLGRACRIELNT